MILSMSAVLLLGLVIWGLIKVRYLRWPEVLLCGSFGFLLAGTVAAPLVRTALSGVSAFLGGLHF